MTLEPLQLDGKVSMTMLRHFNACPRSGYLYEAGKRQGVQNHAMVRGSALHEIMDRCTKAMIDTGEREIPGDLAKAIVDEVLAEYHVPIEEHDYLRECAYRWAQEFYTGVSAHAEQLFALELGGYMVRCKVDYLHVGESYVYIADYKSGRGAHSNEDVGRKRADGTIAAKNFQLVLYALAVVFGRPVDENGEMMDPVAKGAQEVIAEFVYPGIEDKEGRMLRRICSLTRTELLECRESLIAILERVRKANETGDWPAIVSEQGCSECPNTKACPIPAGLRDYAGTINEIHEAQAALERRFVQKKMDAALTRELKAFAKARGLDGIPFGNGMEIGFVYREAERFDKQGFLEAAAQGQIPDPQEFTSITKSTRFEERAIPDKEDA